MHARIGKAVHGQLGGMVVVGKMGAISAAGQTAFAGRGAHLCAGPWPALNGLHFSLNGDEGHPADTRRGGGGVAWVHKAVLTLM